ncbi:heparinase II/III family protein [Sanguibacter sp. 25GB23B1]|uniref:heparinase II/III domain-containing protein n=1 Tax=unclassified Sanguibacter TaxID=2645534 RepID=UPI0032AFCF7B
MSQTPPPFRGPLAAAWDDAAGALALRDSLVDPTRALPAPTASARASWDLDSPEADTTTLAAILARADAEAGTPWPHPTARQYARYFRDGDREEYQGAVFARQHRVTRAVVAAAVTLSPERLDEAADGIVALCEQSTWCWPAHDDTFAAHGAVVPTVTDPYLDLGAGEVAGQLAWADHLLGDLLDARLPGVRARIRHEVHTRVLAPFVRRRDWHWLGLDGDAHNWNPWIHGNVLAAALRLVDDPVARSEIVSLAIEGIDRYVAVLPEDGAVDEGYSYWWNGACRTLEALELLEHATGGALDASGVPALRETVAFPHRMHLGGDWYLNVADGQARPPRDQPWHALHRWALRAGDDDARRHAASYREPGAPVANEADGLGRLVRALTDPVWLDARPEQPPLVRDVWLPSTQVLLARATAGTPRGLTLAAKGGHNGENHNHDDVGSVVVAVGGVPVLVDAGRPTYTAQTFGPDRYALWPMQSAWHSVPEIRGTGQSEGESFAARDVVTSADDARTRMTMDLAAAYPRDDVRRWTRTATLDRGTETVEIEDDWDLTADPTSDPAGPQVSSTQPSSPQPLRLRYLLAGDVRVHSPGVVEIRPTDGGDATLLTWSPATARPTLEVRPLDDPMLADVWGARLTRLTLEIDDTGQATTGTMLVQIQVRR